LPFIQNGLSVHDCSRQTDLSTKPTQALPSGHRGLDPVGCAPRVNDQKERTVSEPQVLEPTELEPETTQQPPADEVLDDDLLVEEISIDGICGVY
jgi:mycofactocin precursor